MARKRPEGIRLGGREWAFRFRRPKAMPEMDGQCHTKLATIDIRRGQSAINEADTVLHEVFHAILFCQGRENGGRQEETYVRALATGLIAALKDNPEFAEWLHSTTKDTS